MASLLRLQDFPMASLLRPRNKHVVPNVDLTSWVPSSSDMFDLIGHKSDTFIQRQLTWNSAEDSYKKQRKIGMSLANINFCKEKLELRESQIIRQFFGTCFILFLSYGFSKK